MLALTVLTVAFWSYFDPSRAFTAALAVLVISCPCAFALAVPAAITRALAVLAQRGVLVVRPDAIQALAEATHVVFDKTGTLTVAELSLGDVATAKGISIDSALRLAGALACHSGHPSARAIVAACVDDTAIQFDLANDVKGRPGFGLSAKIAGREVRLGRADYALSGRDATAFENAVVLADDTGMIAAFQLKERLRPGARAAIDSLKMHGLHVAIASGDAASKVEDIAMRLGISDWRARQSPADKLSWLNSMRAAGARVIAVGDGVNDAPVLAGAEVAIALAGGAELARASSDIVLVGERLEALAPARVLSQQTLAILHQNHRWAMLYNLTAVQLAAFGLIDPWIAALSMSLSSLCVILNALRIGRDTPATRSTAPAIDATAPLEQRTGTA